MKIMAFDSTAKRASVAVLEDEKLLGECNVDNGLTQSELLLVMAENLLNNLKLNFSDIELYATSVGPGSFTGVRIGTALVKGLAFMRDIPCSAVSTLEALAENLSGLSGILVPCMDARRNETYAAIFKCEGGEIKRLTEDMALSIEKLGQMLKEYDSENIYLAGDGYEPVSAGLTKAGVVLSDTPHLLRGQSAYSVARVAKRKYDAGEYVSDTELKPTYLRVPQAERERLERLNGK